MKKNWLFGVLFGGLVAGCGVTQDVQSAQRAHGTLAIVEDEEEDGEEEDVALDQVPDAVKKAAEVAVPGFQAESAEKETEEGALHWCLHGTAGGEFVEIEVDSQGKVLEIEHGEDEEDD